MKLLRLAVPSVLFAGALAACSQPDDVPALQEEATQVSKGYQARFDELEHRARDIKVDGLNVQAQRTFQQGLALLGEHKNLMRQVPLRIQAGVRNHQPAELQKLIDEMHERFEDSAIAINTAIGAVEDQAALVRRGLAPAQPPSRAHAEASNGSTAPADIPAQ